MIYFILFLLFMCHYMGDYVLVTKNMLAAKKFGEPLPPIMHHAAVHTGLMSLVIIPLIPLGVATLLAASCALLVQFISHFVTDLTKGLLTKGFNLTNPAEKEYWWLFGADQLFHAWFILAIALMLFS